MPYQGESASFGSEDEVAVRQPAPHDLEALPGAFQHSAVAIPHLDSAALHVQGSPVREAPPLATDFSPPFFSTNVKRGVRLLNNRRQVLIQDEVTASAPVQWRMHTNATVSIDSTSNTATLTLAGETMIVQVLNMPSGGVLGSMKAQRLSTDPTPPEPDQPNTGVTVLTIDVPPSTFTLEVLFNPQWDGMSASDFVTPQSVALNDWTLTSPS